MTLPHTHSHTYAHSTYRKYLPFLLPLSLPLPPSLPLPLPLLLAKPKNRVEFVEPAAKFFLLYFRVCFRIFSCVIFVDSSAARLAAPRLPLPVPAWCVHSVQKSPKRGSMHKCLRVLQPVCLCLLLSRSRTLLLALSFSLSVCLLVVHSPCVCVRVCVCVVCPRILLIIAVYLSALVSCSVPVKLCRGAAKPAAIVGGGLQGAEKGRRYTAGNRHMPKWNALLPGNKQQEQQQPQCRKLLEILWWKLKIFEINLVLLAECSKLKLCMEHYIN